MPTLEIPDSIFIRLQRHAIPLIDTLPMVLEKLLNHVEQCKNGRAAPAAPAQTPPARPVKLQQFSPDQPPDLRHTRVLFARFGNKPADGWNKLVHAAHIEALSRLKSFDALKSATSSNLLRGRAGSEDTKRGYRYVPEIDISIQNVDAGHALTNALRLARQLQVELTIDFEWMNKPDAAQPGMKGKLEWKP